MISTELKKLVDPKNECCCEYHIAHKCKEWAKLKHFIDIDSHSGCARWGAKAESHNGRPSVFYEQVFIGRTETDAIFKACEWIMEQKK